MKKSICLCALLALMLFHADYVTEGARNGLLLWYSSVVPALFPFMVLSGLIVAGRGISVLMSPFYLFLHPLLGLSKAGCYVLVSGLLCGYPMGAKTCADFVREGRLSPLEGNFLMAFCNHPSPMFLLGYVYPFFAKQLPLGILLLSVYGPVLILAFAARLVCRNGGQNMPRQNDLEMRHVSRQSPSSDETILSAVEILCKIGGYLILFSIVIVFLKRSERIPFLIKLLLSASMEMTTGIREAASMLPFPVSGAVACAALTFGGFSGLFQTKAVLGDVRDLSIHTYFLWKLLHAGLSFAVFFLLTRPLFP